MEITLSVLQYSLSIVDNIKIFIFFVFMFQLDSHDYYLVLRWLIMKIEASKYDYIIVLDTSIDDLMRTYHSYDLFIDDDLMKTFSCASNTVAFKVMCIYHLFGSSAIQHFTRFINFKVALGFFGKKKKKISKFL